MTSYLKPEYPIGIFDSGIGGLTVASAVVKALPKEKIIYFGDTAHLPYGDKSTAAIQAYVIKIIQLLLEQPCKLILIACNSATAAAFELVKEYVGVKALLVNVIDPAVHYLHQHFAGKRVGLIATRQTVNSAIYERKIKALHADITPVSHATNLLASAIEEFGNHPVMDSLLATYLAEETLHTVDALLLACTHYPVVKERIQAYYTSRVNKAVTIIDSSDIVAEAVKQQLEKANLLNLDGDGQKRFYLSDYTESFNQNARLFFEEPIHLQHYSLWD